MLERDEIHNDTKCGERDTDESMNRADGGNDDTGYEEFHSENNSYGEAGKFHVPVSIIAFLLLIIALDLFCMIKFPRVISDYKIYKLAEDRIADGETSAAINDLYDVAERHTDSVPIVIKLVDLSMKKGYYDTAGYIIDTYLVGKSLEDEEYNRINSYYLKLENCYNAYEAVDKIFNPAAGQDEADEAYRDNIKKQLNALLSHSDMDKAYIYYYLGLMESEIMAARDYLQQCYNLDPECLDIRVQLSIMNRRLGDMELAKQYAEEARDKDRRDAGALRAMSTIALAEGKLQEGLRYAEDAYSINPDGIYIRDTYLIALSANGRNEDAEAVREEISQQGQALEDDTLRFLKGEITLEEYYIGE